MQKVPQTTLNFNVFPIHYSLEFEPDFSSWQFRGKVVIQIDIRKPTKLIKLHTKELQIKDAQLVQNGTFGAQIHVDEPKQELQLTFPKVLRGKAVLTILFQGTHNEGMYGFYRSRYMLNGKEESLLTTQFESASARACFPCFDEPFFKATFDVSLTVPQPFTTISNMPIKKEITIAGGKKQVVFQVSPKMSTYLLYLAVGNFKYVETMYRNIKIRVYTVPDKIKYATLSLHYTKTFLQFFEQYFQIRYPLPKLDMLAIPDFASGAMENWGAITFREIALLGDEHTSVVYKQNIAITVAHELAHQWFGNLVTMQWWDDLWLNESFATFMSYKAVHDAFPEWELPLQYFEDTICNALGADQLISTHPITVKVNTPGEIDEIFDSISYDKGGSVLHMLESFVSEKIFREGLHQYLQRHAYSNATKFDLWQAIQGAYKKTTITAMMHRWITQPGYPIVMVSKSKLGFLLQQQRFTLKQKTFPTMWHIPLNYVTADGIAKTALMTQKTLTLKEQKGWIKLNSGQHGFYRVKYETKVLQQLGEGIREKRIAPVDATGIENDLFSLTIQGKYTVDDYLKFVENYCVDAQYPLNSSVSAHLSSLFRITYRKKAFREVRRVSVLFHGNLLKQVGWERKPKERNTTAMLRSMSIYMLGMAGHEATLRKASTLFKQLRTKNTIDQNIKGAIYTLAAWQGDEKTFEYFLERYKNEELPEEQRKLLRSLAMFQNAGLQQRALEVSQSKTVRLQDSMMIPMALSANPMCTLIWPWTKSNWVGLMKKYSTGTHMLPHFVHNLAGVDTPEAYKEIQHFFSLAQHKRDDIKMAVTQTLEKLDVLMHFLEKNKVK